MSLLKVSDLRVHYHTLDGAVRAVDGINFELDEDEFLGFVGESGSGKSTVAYSLLRMVPPPGKIVSGEMLLEGDDLLKRSEAEMRSIRWKKISMIFQGAMNALNPLHTVGDQIAEAILLHEPLDKAEAQKKAQELMKLVGLDSSRANDYPHEFSGGMKQRTLVALSLACSPKIVLADEPVTALDVMVSAQVMELIKDLRKKTQLSMILITHDLSVVAETCNRLACMYAGKIVEYTDVPSFFRSPGHPYSIGLLNAIPSLTGPKKPLEAIQGDPVDLINPPPGCRFQPRCKHARNLCQRTEPELAEITKGHLVACHFADEILQAGREQK